MTKKVIIVGAGITGLTAAYHLIKSGLQVTVIESSSEIGGLASSISVGGVPIEKYYHFICRGDHELINFISELGLAEELHWRKGTTSYFIQNKTWPFNTPFDLIRFAPIPFIQRLRFGVRVLQSQRRKTWADLDKIPAKEWLLEKFGSGGYYAIWDPLLRIKFGKFHDQVSAAWIWHRIHRVAKSRMSFFGGNVYGFLEHGCSMLFAKLLAALTASDAFRLVTGKSVKEIKIDDDRVTGVIFDNDDDFLSADAVISTISIPALLRLLSSDHDYFGRLGKIDYLNIACILLELQEPIADCFWLNVNDPEIMFNGVVQMTNLNARPDLGGSHIAYIPFYLHSSDPKWSFSDEEFYKVCTAGMKIIQPRFDATWVKNWWVSRDRYAQAVCGVDFLDLMPGIETPVKGLYLTDSSQYYPEDRTLSASVILGKNVSAMVANC